MCGLCFEVHYLEDHWKQRVLKEELDMASLLDDQQDIWFQEQESFRLIELTGSSYSILMAKWLAAYRTQAMSIEVLKDLLFHPIPTTLANAPTITLIDELQRASSVIQNDATIPQVLKPFYNSHEWQQDFDQMQSRMDDPAFSKGTYDMLEGFRQRFLDCDKEKTDYWVETFLPLLFLSLADQMIVAPDSTLLQTIALRISPHASVFNAPDLWLQRTAFIHCINYYGLESVLKRFIEQRGRVELLWYAVMKLDMTESEVEQIIQVLEQNPYLCEGAYAEPEFYIERIRAVAKVNPVNL